MVKTIVILTLGTFCQSEVQDCPVKTTQKVRMTGNSFNKRVRFWTISRDVKKMTKIGHFKAKLIQKMTLFGVQKKVTKIGHYKAKLIQKRPFGMRKRHQIEVSSRSKRGAGRPAGRMRVTFCPLCKISFQHSEECNK